jgi:hypothetical protein
MFRSRLDSGYRGLLGRHDWLESDRVEKVGAYWLVHVCLASPCDPPLKQSEEIGNSETSVALSCFNPQSNQLLYMNSITALLIFSSKRELRVT